MSDRSHLSLELTFNFNPFHVRANRINRGSSPPMFSLSVAPSRSEDSQRMDNDGGCVTTFDRNTCNFYQYFTIQRFSGARWEIGP